MDTVTKISTAAVPAAATKIVVNAMASACGLALVMFVCVATNGLDMSPGFF